jgi:hypothetical protein
MFPKAGDPDEDDITFTGIGHNPTGNRDVGAEIPEPDDEPLPPAPDTEEM